VKAPLSRKTLLEVGHALETSAALHCISDVPTGQLACENALKRLRRALHLPKSFSFTSAYVAATKREHAQWLGRARRRKAA
jgi:hypothetical protein